MSISEHFSPLLITLYPMEFFTSLYTFVSLLRYLYRRYKEGKYISAFMMSLCGFLLFFSLSILSSIMARVVDIFGLDNSAIDSTRWILWTVSQAGATFWLGAVGYFIISKRFDIYITKVGPKELRDRRE